jgi:regulator of protease activity HflC (stomatin/prohibitin superfamily)
MKIKNILMVGLCALALAACSRVPAGNVGLKVFLLGGSKGVDTEELTPGRYWIGFNEELFLFPTFMQNYCWTAGNDVDCGSPEDESFSFQTIDGMVASADVGISYSIDPAKVNEIFQTYRRGIDEITDTFLRNMVRDALVKNASSKAIDYVYGAGKAELIESVLKDVQAQVSTQGIHVTKIYWIGEIRLPPPVIERINEKNAAIQQAETRRNEVQSAKAEADKVRETARGRADAVAIEAETQAKANKLLSESLTPELIQYKMLDKWSGNLPQYQGQITPMISLPPFQPQQ